MPTQKLFKRRVRERMSKTGESYTAARRHLAVQRDRAEAAKAPIPSPNAEHPAPVADPPTAEDLAKAEEIASDAKLRERTGKSWTAWIAILDAWSAIDRTHTEIADYLVVEQSVPGWWAQAITNGYERARGMRAKHQQADGFTVYASKTIGVPAEAAFKAFDDTKIRSRWLTDGTLRKRSAQPGKVAYYDWDGGPTRVTVSFDPRGPEKTAVSLAHAKLADAAAGEAAKAAWKPRLAALKALLESAVEPSA